MEFVSWDDDYSQSMESHKIPWFQTTNQWFFCGQACAVVRQKSQEERHPRPKSATGDAQNPRTKWRFL